MNLLQQHIYRTSGVGTTNSGGSGTQMSAPQPAYEGMPIFHRYLEENNEWHYLIAADSEKYNYSAGWYQFEYSFNDGPYTTLAEAINSSYIETKTSDIVGVHKWRITQYQNSDKLTNYGTDIYEWRLQPDANVLVPEPQSYRNRIHLEGDFHYGTQRRWTPASDESSIAFYVEVKREWDEFDELIDNSTQIYHPMDMPGKDKTIYITNSTGTQSVLGHDYIWELYAVDYYGNKSLASIYTETIENIKLNNYATNKNETFDITEFPLKTYSLLYNDPLEAGSEPVTAVLVSTTSNGILDMNDNGEFSYIPDTDFVGTDSFVYYTTNGDEISENYTAYIRVDDEPVVVPAAPTYDSDYQAVLDFATAEGIEWPDESQRAIDNQLLIDYKATGGWDRDDCFAKFNGTAPTDFKLIDWKRLVKMTTSGLNIAFSTNGIKSMGDWINTGYNPSTDAVNFQVDDSAVLFVNNIDDFNYATSGNNNYFFGCGTLSSNKFGYQPSGPFLRVYHSFCSTNNRTHVPDSPFMNAGMNAMYIEGVNTYVMINPTYTDTSRTSGVLPNDEFQLCNFASKVNDYYKGTMQLMTIGGSKYDIHSSIKTVLENI